MTLTRESVLAQIKERPTRFQEFAQSRSANSKRRQAASAIVQQLKADGLIQQHYLDGIPYLVPAGWKPDAAYVQLQIDDRTKRGDDGCLEWVGAFNAHGKPVVRAEDRKSTPVRRWLWKTYRGPIDLDDLILPRCGNELCVCLDHMVKRNTSHIKRGKQRSVATRIRMSMSNQRKITRDDARAIRASTERSADLAARYGVTRETINQVRRGATHREFAGPFAGLGAMQ